MNICINILCLFVVFQSLFIYGCGEKVKPAEVRRRTVTGVAVKEAHPEQVDEFFEAPGTIKAIRSSSISSRVMGTVTSLRVREGDVVRAGQVLATIDDSDVAQKVMAAAAGVREAEKALEAAKQGKALSDVTYNRYKKLFDEKAVSGQEMDQIETQKKVADIEYERVNEMVNRAKAGLSEARIYHGFTSISSPFSGTVTEKKTERGNMAVPGMTLLTVEDTSSLRLEINADEGLYGKLKTGMPVDMEIDSGRRRIRGRISEIVPAIDPMSRTFLVKIDLKRSGLRSGLYAKAKISVGKKEALLLPESAIVERGQLTGAYSVDDKGMITYRLVRIGKHYGSEVEILSGIRDGEKIIVQGAVNAVDGGIIR